MARLQSSTNTPGPGSYAVRREATSPPPHVRFIAPSASAFRSRGPQISAISHCPGSSEFMASTIKDNPGPGEYSTSGNLAKALQVKKDSSHGLASISYSKSMPSMPPKRDPKLQRYSGHETDAIGPGDYDGTIPDSLRRTKVATNFHTSLSQRKPYEQSGVPDGPGPGAFRVERDMQKGTTSGFRSEVKQVPSMVTQDGPGPGTYEELSVGSMSAPTEDKPLAFSGLRSTSDRSQSWQLLDQPFTHPEYVHKVPGPGHYPARHGFGSEKTRRARSTSDIVDTRKYHGVHQPHQVISLRDTDGLKLWGFDTSDEKCKPVKDNGVPTANYNIDESMGQSLKAKLREPAKLGRKGPFGSTGERFGKGSFIEQDTGPCPGPGQHQNVETKDNFYSLRGEQTVRSFRSGLPRFPRDFSIDNSPMPEPCTYEPSDKVNYRNKFRRARSDHLSFGSGASRWDPNEVVGGQKHSTNPGPGGYNPALVVGNIPGGAKSTCQRISKAPTPNDVPSWKSVGPGHYNTHGTTMHGMTYNVSGPDAAWRAQGWTKNVMEPPNIGGGAGGGISATRSRLGNGPGGGAGKNTLAHNTAMWEDDAARRAKKAAAAAKSKKAPLAIQDGQSPVASPSSLAGSGALKQPGSTTPGFSDSMGATGSVAAPATPAAVPAAEAASASAEAPAAADAAPGDSGEAAVVAEPAAPTASETEVVADAVAPPEAEAAPAAGSEAPAEGAPPAEAEGADEF